MSIDDWVELLKLIGALSTAGFGAFGVGAKTREDDGSLTRSGKIAIAGLGLGLFITFGLQVAEQRRSASEAKANADRLEKLVRSSLYGALTVSDARLDMTVRLPLEKIEKLEPHYAARLLAAMDDTPRCTESIRPLGIHNEYTYSCAGYKVYRDWLGDVTMRFEAGSPLLPRPKDEEYAHTLLSDLAVVLITGELDVDAPRRFESPIFGLGKFADQARYMFDGDSLEVSIRNVALEDDYLASRNISSVVDFAGQKVNLHTSVIPFNCPQENSRRCDVLRSILKADVELWRFAVKFPHRRDLMYDRVGGLLDFQEGASKRGYRYYTYSFPASVEDFRIADRSDFRQR